MSTELWDANAIEVKDPKTLVLHLQEPQVAVPEHFFHYPFPMLDPKENGVWGVGPMALAPSRRSRSRLAARPWSRRSTATAPISMPSSSSISATTLPPRPPPLLPSRCDGLYEANIEQLELYQSMDHVNRYDAITADTCVARMQPIKPFDDPRVRKAMRLATDQAKTLQMAHTRRRHDCRAPSRLAGSPRLQEAPDDDAEHRGGEEAA